MKIRIIGVGNLLMGDEGVGIHAVQALEKETWPAEVEVVDGGTAGIGLVGLLDDVDKVIFIDAADMGSAPGTVRRFDPAQVRDLAQGREMSLHDTGLLGVLALARSTGHWPGAVVLYGVQPERLGYSLELSVAGRESVQRLVAEIRDEIRTGAGLQ